MVHVLYVMSSNVLAIDVFLIVLSGVNCYSLVPLHVIRSGCPRACVAGILLLVLQTRGRGNCTLVEFL